MGTFDKKKCEADSELCTGTKGSFVYYIDDPQHTKTEEEIKKEMAEYTKKVAEYQKKVKQQAAKAIAKQRKPKARARRANLRKEKKQRNRRRHQSIDLRACRYESCHARMI